MVFDLLFYIGIVLMDDIKHKEPRQARSVATLLAIVLLAAVFAAERPQALAGQNTIVTRRSALRLDPRIPRADPAKYDAIRDAADWRNPKVTILADGVQVWSDALDDGHTTIAVSELARVLVSLPVSAWPYGRVALASHASIRPRDGRDEAAIRANHDEVDRILRRLRIEANWWP